MKNHNNIGRKKAFISIFTRNQLFIYLRIFFLKTLIIRKLDAF